MWNKSKISFDILIFLYYNVFEKEGNKTRKSIPGRPHAEEKVGIETDPIRQKSGKVVKNCGFYEKNDGKRQECCRNILVDKKM